MDPIRKIPKKFTKKIGNKVINRQYFRRKTGLYTSKLLWIFEKRCSPKLFGLTKNGLVSGRFANTSSKTEILNKIGM